MTGNTIPRIYWTPGFADDYDAYSTTEDDEHLRCLSLGECVDKLFNFGDFTKTCKHYGEIVEIFAFNRETVDPGFVMSHLETLCESLDEEYGDPNGNPYDLLEREPIAAAANNLVRAIVKHYPVWACEVAAVIRVPLREWVEASGVK